MTEQELERWTGRCAPGVLGSLIEITGGRGGYSVALWREWRERGTVEDLTDGRWQFSGGRERLFDEVDDVLYERLERLGLDLNTRDRPLRLLACAALEGRRFTAPAIAAARGWDVNETIDLLDDVLAYDDDGPEGFVVDTGFVTVSDEQGTRHLASYRFARELDWITVRHHGLSDAEQRHLAPRLAAALEAQYGGVAHRIAATLRRLFALAGNSKNAAYYRRMADTGLDRSVLLWRARSVLADGDPVGPAEHRRGALLMLTAAEVLANEGPFEMGPLSRQPPTGSRTAVALRAQARHSLLRSSSGWVNMTALAQSCRRDHGLRRVAGLPPPASERPPYPSGRSTG